MWKAARPLVLNVSRMGKNWLAMPITVAGGSNRINGGIKATIVLLLLKYLKLGYIRDHIPLTLYALEL